MSLSQLPSGKWRSQVYDHTTGKNVGVGTVLGLPSSTFPTKREAKQARESPRETRASRPARSHGRHVRRTLDHGFSLPAPEAQH